MLEFKSLQPSIDPNNRITFLLDWELTLKCNLDCSYCDTGLWGGHDNSTPHPSLESCLQTIDFMFQYVDIYMRHKPAGIRYVIMNVYGGESLHHPDIVEILEAIRNKHLAYESKWHLTITTTTNAVISSKKMSRIIPLIDEFTVSYHAESNDKQKQLFKHNLLSIAAAGKRQKCVVLMHENQELFDDSQAMIQWLAQQNIRMLPRQLDGVTGTDQGRRIYNQQQVKWFGHLYNQKSYGTSVDMPDDPEGVSLSRVGRACCGGRQVCVDNDFKSRFFYVKNQFTDWFCSVNHFFLYVKQLTGDIFVNKDCKMNFAGEVGPIGNLDRTSDLLADLRDKLAHHALPVIQCKKQVCLCGLCAPKAKSQKDYQDIMAKYYKVERTDPS